MKNGVNWPKFMNIKLISLNTKVPSVCTFALESPWNIRRFRTSELGWYIIYNEYKHVLCPFSPILHTFSGKLNNSWPNRWNGLNVGPDESLGFPLLQTKCHNVTKNFRHPVLELTWHLSWYQTCRHADHVQIPLSHQTAFKTCPNDS